MTTSGTTPTALPPKAESVIEAMRSITTESDLWRLAEALYVAIPTGSSGFDAIMDAATGEGIAGKLRATTLRLYRDTAVRWPKDKRVEGMSFTAHREVMPLINSNGFPAAVDLLNQLAKQGKVSIANVRTAVRLKQGKTPTTNIAQRTGAAAPPAVDEVLTDLKAGGKKLIASIGADTGSDELNNLHRGLGRVMAHVESLRAKINQKAKAAAKPTAKASTGKTVAKPAAAAKRGGRGDLRGL